MSRTETATRALRSLYRTKRLRLIAALIVTATLTGGSGAPANAVTPSQSASVVHAVRSGCPDYSSGKPCAGSLTPPSCVHVTWPFYDCTARDAFRDVQSRVYPTPNSVRGAFISAFLPIAMPRAHDAAAERRSMVMSELRVTAAAMPRSAKTLAEKAKLLCYRNITLIEMKSDSDLDTTLRAFTLFMKVQAKGYSGLDKAISQAYGGLGWTQIIKTTSGYDRVNLGMGMSAFCTNPAPVSKANPWK